MPTQIVRENVILIPDNMVKYMPTGEFSNALDAINAAMPEWVKAYMAYNNMDTSRPFKIISGKGTNTFAIKQKKV